MKVGNIVDGLVVTDVKRINKMNLIQFTKAVSEYIEQGYKIDVHSSRQVGALQLMVDMYKLESNVSESVGNVGDSSTEDVVSVEDNLKEDVTTKSPELTAEAHSDVMLPVTEPNETTIEAMQESTDNLETVETIDDVIEEALADLKESDKDVQDSDEVKQEPPVKKATRTKKQTT